VFAAWEHQMQAGVSKRQELEDKFKAKFNELGVSIKDSNLMANIFS
jgi:hypothetical protein